MGRTPSGLHHPVSQYAKQVVSGRLHDMCGPYEILACQRHLDDLKRQGTPDFPYVFDTTRADRIIRFFGQCVHVRGVYSGKPIEPQPWQIFDQGCLYGWVHMETGARRFSVTYNKRARGNVKSTENSVKCCYHMTADALYPPYKPDEAIFEWSPEVECAGVDRGQARRVWGDAQAMALASPNIAKRLIVKKTYVTHRTRGGFMRAQSKDLNNKDSGAPSYFSVDEYHAYQDSTIYDRGRSGFGKRPQALLDCITTAGDDAENKPCKREEDYAKSILRGEVANERYFVMIRECSAEDNPHDKASWLKANPVLRFPNEYSRYLLDEIESEYTAAYGSGDPDKIRDFLTRRMCIWQAMSVNSYFNEPLMRALDELFVSPDEFAALTDGRPCNCGYDLGKRIDLSGVGAVFDLQDGRIAIKAHGFLPENAAVRHEHTDRVPYMDFARDSYCTLTPGDVTDNSYVYNWISEGIRDHGWTLDEVDYDGHNATDLAILMGREWGEDRIVEIAQTCAGLNQATKRFRELCMEGKLVIEYNPLFRRCVANAIEVVNNFGDIKLSKKHKDDSRRIDPLAAVLNALARVIIKYDNRVDINRIIEERGFVI